MRRLLPGSGGSDDLVLDDGGLLEAYRLPPGPSLRVNFIATLDGATTLHGRSGGLGSPGDRRVMATLRALADVVLVGHGTAATEGYGPVLADSAVGRLRTSIGRPATAPIAVVSRHASLDPRTALVTDGASPTILVTCAAADPDRRAALAAAGADVLVCGDDEVDLALARARLAERGLAHITCEGGPRLLRSLLAADLVDELDLTIAPTLVGGGTRLLDAALPAAVGLELRQLLEDDGFLFARYRPRPAR